MVFSVMMSYEIIMTVCVCVCQGLLAEGIVSSCHEIADEDHFTVTERLVEHEYSLTKLILAAILHSEH